MSMRNRIAKVVKLLDEKREIERMSNVPQGMTAFYAELDAGTCGLARFYPKTETIFEVKS